MHRPRPTAGLLNQPSSSNTSGRLGSVEELLGNNRASLKHPKARRSGYFECIDSSHCVRVSSSSPEPLKDPICIFPSIISSFLGYFVHQNNAAPLAAPTNHFLRQARLSDHNKHLSTKGASWLRL